MNMTITGEIKVLIGPSKEITQQVLIDGIRRGRGAVMAEFLRGGNEQGPDKPVFMGEFKLIRPAIDEAINPQGFSVEEKAAVLKLWESVKQQVNECNFLILDGIGDAVSAGIIPLSSVLDMLSEKPTQVDVILTGLTMPKKLQARASEIRKMGEGNQ
jgi:cob(I)alamin adenosyltransferase